MGKVTGFLEIDRQDRATRRPPTASGTTANSSIPLSEEATRDQAARCMDCGIPYLPQRLPGQQPDPGLERPRLSAATGRRRSRNLHSTNNFPEFTGRVCPAPCEASCTLNINDEPVTIKTIECAIVDRAWEKAGSSPSRRSARPARRSRSSAPARRASPARSSSRAPATTCMSSRRTPKAGGLLRYGIPDFKMEKHLIDRRVAQMEAEGVTFHYGVHVGVDAAGRRALVDDYDAVLLAGGAEKPRDLPVPGRELDGVHFAMEFLPQQNRRVGRRAARQQRADPRHRQACHRHRRRRHRLRLHRHVDPPGRALGHAARDHAEAAGEGEQAADLAELAAEAAHLVAPRGGRRARLRASLTKEFGGENGKVKQRLQCVARRRQDAAEVPGSEFDIQGRSRAARHGLRLARARGHARGARRGARPARQRRGRHGRTTDLAVDKVFACGDMRRGQSLVVWAIREGRQAARAVDQFLMGASDLPR